MRGFVPPDPQTSVSEERFAVIYTPRKGRTRFPAANTTVVATADEALAMANAEDKIYPARVIGPSKSSEGVSIFYLMHWLDE